MNKRRWEIENIVEYVVCWLMAQLFPRSFFSILFFSSFSFFSSLLFSCLSIKEMDGEKNNHGFETEILIYGQLNALNASSLLLLHSIQCYVLCVTFYLILLHIDHTHTHTHTTHVNTHKKTGKHTRKYLLGK